MSVALPKTVEELAAEFDQFRNAFEENGSLDVETIYRSPSMWEHPLEFFFTFLVALVVVGGLAFLIRGVFVQSWKYTRISRSILEDYEKRYDDPNDKFNFFEDGKAMPRAIVMLGAWIGYAAGCIGMAAIVISAVVLFGILRV